MEKIDLNCLNMLQNNNLNVHEDDDMKKRLGNEKGPSIFFIVFRLNSF